MSAAQIPGIKAPTGRPLPRRRSKELRLAWIDAAWIVAVGLVALSAAESVGPGMAAGKLMFVLVAVATYFLGFTSRDRTTGIIAGFLLASCLPAAVIFAHRPLVAVLALTIAAALGIATRFPEAAAALCGVATGISPVGPGAVAATWVIARTFRFAANRGPMSLAIGLIGCLAAFGAASLGHVHASTLLSATAAGVTRRQEWSVYGTGIGFAGWFLVPACTDMADRQAFARWVAPIFVTLSLLLEAALSPSTLMPAVLACSYPAIFALCGAGFSRVMPAAAGDMPSSPLRYGMAVATAVVLLGLQGIGSTVARVLIPHPHSARPGVTWTR